jgi:hypothetical protein
MINGWGLIGGLGAGAGIGLARNFMAPDGDKLPEYKPVKIEDRLDDLDPGARDSLVMRRSISDRLMTGEIPQEVREQVEMLSAENAWRGGFGMSPRATNMTARDLGLMSLSLMQQGAEMGAKLTEMELDMAVADANEEYKAFVARYNKKVQKNSQKRQDYDNMWNSILQVGAIGATMGPSKEVTTVTPNKSGGWTSTKTEGSGGWSNPFSKKAAPGN